MNREELRQLARQTHITVSEIIGTSEFTISGGYLRDNLNDDGSNDIDCFFTCKKEYEKAFNNAFELEVIKTRKNSVQVKTKGGKTIDIIFTYEGYVFEFDFHMNMISYNYKKDEILLSDEVEHVIKEKILTIKTDKLPLGLIERAKKFYERGWKISKETKIRLMNNYLDGVSEATY